MVSFLASYLERNRTRVVFFLVTSISVIGFLYIAVSAIQRVLDTPPNGFPIGNEIIVEEGHTLSDVTSSFKEKNLVRSSLYLYVVLSHSFDNALVRAGTYKFETPQTTFEIARALAEGLYSAPSHSVTFPEGFSTKDIQTYLPDDFPTVNIKAIQHHEGYLFPDTYFITNTMTLDDIIALQRKTFDEKISPLEGRIIASGLEKEEVIILASLIEREAKSVESKGRISGILRKRLEIGMPLQVDATFMYLLGKTSAELTIDDLELDSPYNTYRYAGLPPAPISNPGLEAILAVLNPILSDDLYYLTDNEGTFHYARTFEEHKLNKARYLW